MSEPAEVLSNTSTALAGESDPHLTKENIKLVDLEKELNFFKGQCKVQVANSVTLRQKAYELLYDLYIKKGFTKKTEYGLWLSIYDALPETTTFVAKDNQGCIEGALTAVFDSPIGLPADELYKEEIDALRNYGGQICEFVSLGINDTVKNHLKILASLFYSAYLLAWRKKNASNLIITVNPQHENFYCRKTFFQKIGSERNFSKVNGAPSVLLNVPLRVYSRLKHEHRIFPFFMIDYSDQEELETIKKIEDMIQPMSDEEFFTFFIEKTDTWERALPHQRDFIKKAYPAHEINHNEVSRFLAKRISRNNDQSDHTFNHTNRAIY
jgi:N-acyl amino acid synthase FeeM